MSNARNKFIAGNWKMNGTLSSLSEIEVIKSLFGETTYDIVILPPATLLAEASKIVAGSKIKIGAQNCHQNISGAHTGEISVLMLKDIGINTVLLGHSERRTESMENNQLINLKAETSHNCKLTTIICVGETELERKNGDTEKTIEYQLLNSLPKTFTEDNTIIAYEPVWAIGTGKTATAEEIHTAHAILRNKIKKLKGTAVASKIRILYGGSVNKENSSEIFQIEGVDGALVGGASLLSADFSSIIKSISR